MKKVLVSFLVSALLVFGSAASVFAATFSDVSSEDWFYAHVENLVDQGILTGFSDETFHPEWSLTRAEAVKLVVMGLIGEDLLNDLGNEGDHFDDVFPSAWFAEYVAVAEALELIDSDDLFYPYEPIDRASFVKLIVKAIGLDITDEPYSVSDFSDVDEDAWYFESIQLAADYHLVSGYSDDTFRPGQLVNRAEAAKMIVLAQEYQEENGDYFTQENCEACVDEEETTEEDDSVVEGDDTAAEGDDDEALELLDCEDFECFVDASELCTPAGVTIDTETDVFGLAVYTATLSMEIRGYDSEDRCTLYTIYDSIEAEFTEDYIDALQEEEEMTEEDIEQLLVDTNDELDSEFENSATICYFEGDALFDTISGWDPEIITLFDFDEFVDVECEDLTE